MRSKAVDSHSEMPVCEECPIVQIRCGGWMLKWTVHDVTSGVGGVKIGVTGSKPKLD
jgi:hypothetical protein